MRPIRLIFRIRPKILFEALGAILIASVIIGLFGYFSPKAAEAAWKDDNWHFRKKLAVTAAKVSSGPHAYFPVLVSLDNDASLKSHAQTTGNDILFTDSDGTTQLSHEIESYTSATGTLRAWVKVTSLSTTSVLYMYYGNYSAADQSDTNSVWSESATGTSRCTGSNFKGVWHLKDIPTGSAGDIADSTYCGNNGQSQGSMGSSNQVTGKINGSLNFNGLDYGNSVDFGSGDSLDNMTTWTYEVWVNPSQVTTDRVIFAKHDGNSIIQKYLQTFVDQGNGTVSLVGCFYDDSNNSRCTNSGSNGIPSNSWSHVVWTCDPSLTSLECKIYINGSQKVTFSVNGSAARSDAAESLALGAAINQYRFPGGMDEARVSNTVRTAGWITTEYNNQSDPGSFFSTGSEEKSKDPILYWKFDDSQGTTAYDSSATKNNGTIANGTWATEDMCVSGKCLSFNGTSSKLTAGAIVSSVKTVGLWVRPKTTSESIIDFDGGTHKISATSGTITATGFDAFYVNGVQSASLTANTWQYIEATVATAFDTTVAGFTVGLINTTYFNGFIDDVKLYDYVRSANQIKADFASRGSVKGVSAQMGGQDMKYLSDGLVGYWKTDEASGNAADSSGNSLTLTNNSTMAYATGKFSNGVQCDGTADYLNTATAINGIKTVSFWVKTAAAANNYFINLINSSSYITIDSSGVVTATGFTSPSIYVNGILNGTVSAAIWSLVTVTTGTGIDANAFAVGLTNDGSNHFCTNTSLMDEVRVYNRALSSKEARDLYNFAPGPVGYWNFEEGSGTAANDSSGNANNGTLTAGTGGFTPGKYGKGINFDNADTLVNSGSGTTLDNLPASGMTAEAWIYPKGLGENSAGFILAKNVGTTPSSGWILQMAASNALTFTVDGSTDLVRTTATSAVTSNTWNHVVVSWDGVITTASSVHIYVNGVEVTYVTTTNGASRVSDATSTFYIGNDSTSAATFNGIIDDVRVYNYARTGKQIVSDMNAGHPAVGSPVGSAVGYWKFDEGADNKCSGGTNDVCNSGSAGSALDGAKGASNAPAWTNSGKFGKALDFDGTDDSVSVSDNAAISLTTAGSISTWISSDIQYPSTDGTALYREIVNKRSSGTCSGTGESYFMDWYGTNSSATLRGRLCNGTSADGVTYNTTLTVGAWYHAVFTWDGTNYKLYLNGKEVATAAQTVSSQDDTATLTIGNGFGATTNGWDGKIDEVKIYNYALTSDEVKTEYNRGSSLVLGAAGNNSTYAAGAANQEYCVPGDSTSCAVPVGEWKFEEGSGTSAYDTSGNNNTGTITAGTGSYANGKIGKGYSFDKASTVMNAGSAAGLDNIATTGSQDLTVGAWIYPKSEGENNAAVIIGKANGTDPANGWLFQFDPSGSNLLRFIADTGATDVQRITSTAVTLNAWNHVVATWTGSGTDATSIHIYINGLEAAYGTTTNGSTSPTTDAAQNLLIGNDSGSAATWDGKIDEVEVFTYARTPAQVAWDYNQGKPVAWWKFDECTGTTVNDSSGNSRSGTITIGGSGEDTVGTCATSSTSWGSGATGKRNYSLNLDGNDDFITTAAFSPLASAGSTTTQISWGGWFYPTTSVASRYLVEKATNSTTAGEFHLYADSNSMPICGIFYSSAFHDSSAPTTALTLSAWNHVLCTYDGANINTYLNGELVKQSVETTAVTAASSILYLGEPSTSPSSSNRFEGQLDDVRIYNYALTANQVKQVMNDGAVRFGPGSGSP